MSVRIKNKDQEQIIQTFNIVAMGNKRVGKTAMAERFVLNDFVTRYEMRCFEDRYTKKCIIDDVEANVDILDNTISHVMAQEIYMKNGEGFLLVFSLTDRASFTELPSIYERILLVKDRDVFPMLMVGNKADLEEQRDVSAEEAQTFARELKIPYIECSAKIPSNVDQCFHELVRIVRKFQEAEKESTKKELQKKTKGSKSSCAIF